MLLREDTWRTLRRSGALTLRQAQRYASLDELRLCDLRHSENISQFFPE